MLETLLENERRKFSTALAALLAFGTALLAVISHFHWGQDVPPPEYLLALSAVATAFAVLSHRYGGAVPRALPWLSALTIPFLLVGKSLTEVVDPSLLLSPAVAVVLGRRSAIVGTAAFQLAVVVLRHPQPRQSLYLDVSYLLVFVSLILVFVFTQTILNRALTDALQTKVIAGAASVASDDLVLLRQVLPDGRLGAMSFLSESVGRVLGYTPAALSEANFGVDLIVAEDRESIRQALRDVVSQKKKSVEWEARIRNISGVYFWYHGRTIDLRSDCTVRGVITVLRNIDEQKQVRAVYELELKRQALQDALTGLPNRRRLNDVLDAIVPGEVLALLVCDFDGFKSINESIGHHAGDQILREVSAQLMTHEEKHVSLFRIGGDEFVFVLNEGAQISAEALAAKLVEQASLPIAMPNQASTVLTLSIGIATEREGSNSQEQLRNADLAMVAAKEAGKNRYQVFNAGMEEAAKRRHGIEQALRIALNAGELSLLYQPKTCMRSGALKGFEALLRWNSATLGHVSPAEFIPIAEETGLILSIGEYVVREACREFASWKRPDCTVAVNLSGTQLADEERLLHTVESALSQSGLPPAMLELELTESTFMKHPEATIKTLKRLKHAGVSLSVDDFGTGYSSLAYIRRFPIDTLKIDRSFVTQLDESDQSRAVVAAVIALARELKICTVVEGIETEQEFRALKALGCDQAQGYFFAQPLKPELARMYAGRASKEYLFTLVQSG
jgi:diguanylate cyclase (GGDEF)-like protein/PAS domain S-box-containing protein